MDNVTQQRQSILKASPVAWNLTVSTMEAIYMYTYANREELDKIPQNALFHPSLHCWLRYNLSEIDCKF